MQILWATHSALYRSKGDLAGTEYATFCDKLLTELVLVGSNQKHTTTGLVDCCIAIVKTVMLKTTTDMVANMTIDFSDAMMEACMATNCLCVHDGIAPAIGVTGQLQRDYPELDNTSPMNDVLLPGEACMMPS